MFGEEALLGKIELTLDSKNRLILPTSTKREPGEVVVIVEDKDLDLYKIYSESKITAIFDKLNEELIKATKKTDEINYKKKILELSRTIIRSVKVDKQGKIYLGTKFTNVTNVNLIGAYDHMILELKK